MHKILKKVQLCPIVYLMEVEAPLIAKKNKPGQFVVLRIHEKGERIPLTIVNSDEKHGSITLIFQVVGKTTKLLSKLNEGEYILNIAGPLGKPTEIEHYGTVVLIGGGVGAAEIYPEAKAFKAAGNYVIGIVGARTANLLILENELKQVCDEFYIATDDGSKGYHGFVSDVLKQLIDKGVKIDLVYAVGPTIMMKVISNLTKPYGIKTLVSLNPIMLDATGMCGVCRVKVGGEIKFACVDGPEFDGHLVDFDLLMARQRTYLEEEKKILEIYEKMEKS
ncbi:MAG: sulfide/dihydroorotate dehydrogenase-like FAD/NAD-binding protein [Candidatus Bathyarchaeia archaeon]|nr:sulfide/dihydroorotate dehydrogenase-like FAD/NAD-binding protein [Candidatus Bathyarchaeota archaeon]